MRMNVAVEKEQCKEETGKLAKVIELKEWEKKQSQEKSINITANKNNERIKETLETDFIVPGCQSKVKCKDTIPNLYGATLCLKKQNGKHIYF